MARKPPNIFSLSFLDAMTCGFGAIILLFMIINANIDLQEEQGSASLPQLDEEAASNYLAQLQKLKQLGGVDGKVELQLIIGLPGIFKTEGETRHGRTQRGRRRRKKERGT